MNNKLKHLIEGAIFVLFFLAIYWFIGFIIKKIFNREIRNTTGYTICVVGGFVSRRFLITLLQ